MSSFHS